MSPALQAKLLRVLQEREFERVGDSHTIKIDVRVIAATHSDLARLVAEGTFREDLYDRLNVLPVQLPPLRDRREDIPMLVRHFLEGAPRPLSVSDAAMQILTDYRWPGNVRELRNVVEQVIARARTEAILPADLPAGLGARRLGASANAERRQRVADELYQALVSGRCTFWGDIHPLFLMRDMTREDLRELVRRGLSETRGNYRALLLLFRLPPEDYKRFLNFLTTHDCSVDFRSFRGAEQAAPERRPRALLLGTNRKTSHPKGLIDDPRP